MPTKNETNPVPELPLSQIYRFGVENNVVKFTAEWTTRQFGVICDLDLHAYCYDDRARFIEKLDVSCKRTADGAVMLMADIDGQQSQTSNTYCELIKVDFRLVDPATTAILLVLDGGSKYFQLVANMWVHCSPWAAGKAVNMPGQNTVPDLFNYTEKAKKEYQSVGLGVIFRDGWMEEDETRAQWCVRALMDPMYVTTKKAKDEKCLSVVVGNVPSLEKYKPRLFGAVKDLCSALSSVALPKLKKKFIATPGGLDITTFTETIFRQLYETHPLIIEPSESAYTVAMIQEMFQQIDYNGDGGADWDEFTTFCIQTASAQDTAGHVVSMDEYVIEYNEDITLREKKSTAYRPAVSMKYFPETKKFVVIPDEQDKILILDKKFRTRSILKADNMIVKGKTGAKEVMKQNEEESSKVMIYDVVFLSGRDMYAFSASDHGISICKEQGSVGSKKVNILLYTKIYHTQLHVKLCWSKAHQLLCSIGADRVIYGWDIDKTQPLFQVTRHSDLITDFICVDHLDCFITCSMDKRIVMWSANTRRVKGIMVGHKRGVRCLSAHDTLLLSAGYELDARTWDLNSKENLALLKGHRQPIVDAKLMCELCHSEKDYRAVTVDESGELRLWNVYVAERQSDPVLVPTLQTFTMLNPEYPMKYVRFLAIPNTPNLSQSYYSNLVACGTRMLHFVPEKNAKEFIPPSAAVFNEAAAEFMVAVGKKLLKYDVCTGAYVGAFEPYPTADLTAACLELPRCRRLFVGSSNGEVMIVNYDSGLILDQVSAHAKEVSCILISKGDRNQVFSGSVDGRLVMTEEVDGALHIHNTIDRAFGDSPINGLPIGVVNIKLATQVGAVIVQSAGPNWGIWDLKTFKRRLIFAEPSVVMAFEVLGCTGDAGSERKKETEASAAGRVYTGPSAMDRQYQVTLAVALQPGIKIITCDIAEARGICTHFLQFDKPIYINALTLLRTPEGDSVNYAGAKFTGKKVSLALAGATDEGKIALWEVEDLRFESELLMTRKFPSSSKNAISTKTTTLPSLHPTTTTPHGSVPGTRVTTPVEGSHTHTAADTTTGSHLEYGGGGDHHNHGTGTDGHGHENEHEHEHGEGHGLEHSIDGGGSQLSLTSSVINTSAIDSTVFFGAPKGGVPIVEIPCLSIWTAHLDSICCVVPMHEHGCLVTGSHDGFKRVWNMEQDCLGELQLPNLTNKMKHPPKPIFPTTRIWKFILEKIPILEHHRMLADYLVKLVQTSDLEAKSRSHHIGNDALAGLAGLLGFGEDDEEEEEERRKWAAMSEQERLRVSMLTAMNMPAKVPEDGPPLTLPSKADRKLQIIAERLEEHAETLKLKEALAATAVTTTTANSRGDGDLFNLTELTLEPATTTTTTISPSPHAKKAPKKSGTPRGAKSAPGKLEAFGLDQGSITDTCSMGMGFEALGSPSPASRGVSPKQSPMHSPSMSRRNSTLPNTRPGTAGTTASTKPHKHLYYAAGENVTDKTYLVPPAFSEQSLTQGQNDKSIDEEGLLLLRRFAVTTKEKIEQYESSGATIMLRSPSLSTSIKLPELAGMRRAEICFGAQKELYKNAEKELNERPALKMDKMRDAITRSRIDDNVQKLSSMMMSVISPLANDEVHIPNEAEAWKEKREKDEKEHFRMKVRLMQSASLVSLHVEDKDRAASHTMLDRTALAQISAKVAAANESETERLAESRYLKQAGKKERTVVEPTAKESLLKKFKNAIRDEYIYRNKAEAVAGMPGAASMLEDFGFADDGPGSSTAMGGKSLPQSPSSKGALTVDSGAGAGAGGGGGGGEVGGGGVATPSASSRSLSRKNTATNFAADVKGGSGAPGDKDKGGVSSRRGSQLTGAGAGTMGSGTTLSGEEETKSGVSQGSGSDAMSAAAVAEEEIVAAGEYKGQGVAITKEGIALASSYHGHGASGASTPERGTGSARTPKSAASGTASGGSSSSSSSALSPAEKLKQQQQQRLERQQSASTLASASGQKGREGYSSSSSAAATGAPASSSPGSKPGTAVSVPGTAVSTPGNISKVGLTTRALLPYYKFDDVVHFLEIFAKVDENFSGDLDMEEWTTLFKTLSNNIPAQEARSIFMKFKNEDGFLSMKELVPVVFSKANKEQTRLIIAHCNSEIVKKSEGVCQLTFNELEQLFENFDTHNFGYVQVSVIREQIRNLPLQESMITSCLQSFKYVDDDEMVSPSEFTRFFKMYISKAELLQQKTAELRDRFKIK